MLFSFKEEIGWIVRNVLFTFAKIKSFLNKSGILRSVTSSRKDLFENRLNKDAL